MYVNARAHTTLRRVRVDILTEVHMERFLIFPRPLSIPTFPSPAVLFLALAVCMYTILYAHCVPCSTLRTNVLWNLMGAQITTPFTSQQPSCPPSLGPTTSQMKGLCSMYTHGRASSRGFVSQLQSWYIHRNSWNMSLEENS